jgi:DNA-binding transcriptional regulator LsrR (DeoR family)
MNFLDIEGRPVDHPIQERRVSGNLQMAHRRAREVIVVANGIAKAEILRATMVGQWVDTVVTDEDTARAVLEM